MYKPLKVRPDLKAGAVPDSHDAFRFSIYDRLEAILMDAASSLQRSAIETSSSAKERRSRSSFGLRLLRRPISTVDGCWSWIVCISAFFLTFFTLGLLESFSVLYIGFLDKFSPDNETNSTQAKISGSVGQNLINKINRVKIFDVINFNFLFSVD